MLIGEHCHGKHLEPAHREDHQTDQPKPAKVGFCEQPFSLRPPKGRYRHGGCPGDLVASSRRNFKFSFRSLLLRQLGKSNVLTASYARGLDRNPAMPSQAGWKDESACAKLKHRGSSDFAARLTHGRRKEAETDRVTSSAVCRSDRSIAMTEVSHLDGSRTQACSTGSLSAWAEASAR